MIMPKEMKKYRKAYVRIAQQRALGKMKIILMAKPSFLKEYTYRELRELYGLSEFTIRSGNHPLFLLQEASKLDLIDEEEKLVLFRDDEVLMRSDINTASSIRHFLTTGIKELSNEKS